MTTPAFGEVKEHVRAELLAVALTQRLGVPVTIEPAQSYDELVQALEHGEAEVIWGTAELCDRYENQARAVLRAVRSGSCAYHAALICRADEPLRLDGLEGTTAAWVTRWSTAGYLLPRAHLEENGIHPDTTFGSQVEYGTYRRALLAVLEGEADVAATYCTYADDRAVRASLMAHVGRREAELVPFAFTRATPADGILITSRLPEEQAVRLIDALMALGANGSGLLPELGLFDTEGFALDGHVLPRQRLSASFEPLLMLEVASDLSCQRAWSQSGKVNGRKLRELVGAPLAEVLGREGSGPVAALVVEAFRHGVGGRAEYHAGTEEDPRCFSAEVAPPSDDEGTAALIIRDVTDEKALEDDLFHLASFPLLTPDPVLEIDRDGALIYANRAAHERFPGLVTQGADHPIIATMLAANRSSNRFRRAVLREVEVDRKLWKLAVLSPPNTDSIRAQVIDVTEAQAQRSRRLG